MKQGLMDEQQANSSSGEAGDRKRSPAFFISEFFGSDFPPFFSGTLNASSRFSRLTNSGYHSNMDLKKFLFMKIKEGNMKRTSKDLID